MPARPAPVGREQEGVELLVVEGDTEVRPDDVEVAIVLGATGRCFAPCNGFLGTGIPVIGVNFGRVGFLSAIPRDELERGIARVLAGELEVVELATLEVEADGERFVSVNDAVVASGDLGRMVELEWSLGGENSAGSPATG